MRWYSKSWAPLVAFLILALAGGYALYTVQKSNATTLYHTQLAGCDRGNQIREESNARAVYNQQELDVLREFLDSARQARVAAYSRDHHAADKKASEAYASQIKSLEGISFKQVPVVNCLKVILKP